MLKYNDRIFSDDWLGSPENFKNYLEMRSKLFESVFEDNLIQRLYEKSSDNIYRDLKIVIKKYSDKHNPPLHRMDDEIEYAIRFLNFEKNRIASNFDFSLNATEYIYKNTLFIPFPSFAILCYSLTTRLHADGKSFLKVNLLNLINGDIKITARYLYSGNPFNRGEVEFINDITERLKQIYQIHGVTNFTNIKQYLTETSVSDKTGITVELTIPSSFVKKTD